MRRLAIMGNAGNPAILLELREVYTTAHAFGLEVAQLEIPRTEDIAPVFPALGRRNSISGSYAVPMPIADKSAILTT